MVGGKLKVAVLYDVWEDPDSAPEEPIEKPTRKRKPRSKTRKQKEDRE